MIGLMQGRLTESKSGKIQEFPKFSWEDEFPLLKELEINYLEWTVDWEDYESNPIFTKDLQFKILRLCQKYSIKIETITLDNFVEAPLGFKHSATGKTSNLSHFDWILSKLEGTNIEILVIPLVKESGISNQADLQNLIKLLPELQTRVSRSSKKIAFECEFDLVTLNHLVKSFSYFPNIGFNFDIGNSASLGNDPEQEIYLLGKKIFNVHVKDRKLGGETVPLGQGNANFNTVFPAIRSIGYNSRYILQAARSKSISDFNLIKKYKEFCENLG